LYSNRTSAEIIEYEDIASAESNQLEYSEIFESDADEEEEEAEVFEPSGAGSPVIRGRVFTYINGGFLYESVPLSGVRITGSKPSLTQRDLSASTSMMKRTG